jgi:carbamoyl-phosphate synthase large subunit
MQIPRFAFEKFPGSEPILTTQMKYVGEAMALGCTFQESFQKAVRSLETGFAGWGCGPIKELVWDWEKIKYNLWVPNPEHIHAIYAAFKKGMKVEDIHEISFIDKWFLTELKELVDVEQFLLSKSLDELSKDDFYQVKRSGFSDKQIAFATSSSESDVRLRCLAFRCRSNI